MTATSSAIKSCESTRERVNPSDITPPTSRRFSRLNPSKRKRWLECMVSEEATQRVSTTNSAGVPAGRLKGETGDALTVKHPLGKQTLKIKHPFRVTVIQGREMACMAHQIRITKPLRLMILNVFSRMSLRPGYELAAAKNNTPITRVAALEIIGRMAL